MLPSTPARRAIALLLAWMVVPACGSAPVSPTPTAPPMATGTDQASAAPFSTLAATDALAARTIATLDIGGGPDLPTEAFGSLWIIAVDGPLMNDGTSPAVHRIDPDTNEVIASVPLPGRLCQGLGASPEAIWACGPDGLVRIDPATNEVVATVDFEPALVVSRLAYGAGSVWAFATATVGPDLVVRVDPATNTIAATIELDRTAGTMAFGFDALWVTSPADDQLLRIDPATNAVEEWSEGLEAPGLVVVGADALWVSLLFEENPQSGEDDATVVRIEPETGDVTASIATGGALATSFGMTATADGIWVRGSDPILVRIDLATNEVVDRIDARGGPGDVAVAFGSIWVTSERGEVIRLEQ